MPEPVHEPARQFACAEWSRQADEKAQGWRAFLTSDEPEEVAVFCPTCAAVEFGD